MEEKRFLLTEKERIYKNLYKNGGEKLLKNPMTFYQFSEINNEVKRYYKEYEIFHENISLDYPGNTIKDVAVLGEQVEIVRHSRYSYPVLHNHNYIELIYVYSGNCIQFVETQRIEMKEGDICILAPKAMHAVSATDDNAVIINIMMSRKLFDIGFLKILKGDPMLSEFLEHILYNQQVSPYLMFPTGEDPWIHQTLLNMYREKEEKAYLYNESIILLIKQLFIHLIRHYELLAIVSNPMDNEQENHIIAVMAYISINYSHITLKEVAQFFGYNDTYLGQMIQKYTNQNFCAIVSRLQMKNASKLLRETSLSVTEIGCEVGCYDASHFTRKFKKEFGMTPNQYRAEKTVDRKNIGDIIIKNKTDD